MIGIEMYLPEQAVTKEFRATVAALVPALDKNIAYWRLLGYVMFAGGAAHSALLVPAELLALMEGKQITGRYRAWGLLERFQEDTGIKLDIRPWTYEQCRAIKKVHLSKELLTLLAEERRVSGGDRVLFSNGVKWRREHTTNDRARQQAEALETFQNMGHHPAYDLLNLLDNAAPARFKAIHKYLPDAHALVDTLPLVKTETERQHNILQAIERQAQPFFGPSARSVRIFATNDSLTRLQRDVRKLMTRDWVTCDLRSAQLAIVAKTWDIPEVAAFLQSGQSIWSVLCDWMYLDYNEHNKAVLKNVLYAVIFGALPPTIKKELERIGPGLYERFTQNPIIQSLFAARDRTLRKIRKDKFGVDAFGTRIAVEYITVPGKVYMHDKARSVLALIAQSHELMLLTPVIELAKSEKQLERGFTLMTWLHDGFTFVPHKSRDRDKWTERLRHAVRIKAESMGIVTELD